MIEHPAFTVEEWSVREMGLHLDTLAQTESVFALSNGHIGLRGNLDEGEPHGLPGTYLNSVYELSPLPYAEAGYGYPESGQFIANVTMASLFACSSTTNLLTCAMARSRATIGNSTSAPEYCVAMCAGNR